MRDDDDPADLILVADLDPDLQAEAARRASHTGLNGEPLIARSEVEWLLASRCDARE